MSVAASGACRTVVVSVAKASAHGEAPVTVYTYGPVTSTAGSNVGPYPRAGPDRRHLVFRSSEAACRTMLHRYNRGMLLLTPAFGAVVWETVTVAEADGQGAVPGTVYI